MRVSVDGDNERIRKLTFRWRTESVNVNGFNQVTSQSHDYCVMHFRETGLNSTKEKNKGTADASILRAVLSVYGEFGVRLYRSEMRTWLLWKGVSLFLSPIFPTEQIYELFFFYFFFLSKIVLFVKLYQQKVWRIWFLTQLEAFCFQVGRLNSYNTDVL